MSNWTKDEIDETMVNAAMTVDELINRMMEYDESYADDVWQAAYKFVMAVQEHTGKTLQDHSQGNSKVVYVNLDDVGALQDMIDAQLQDFSVNAIVFNGKFTRLEAVNKTHFVMESDSPIKYKWLVFNPKGEYLTSYDTETAAWAEAKRLDKQWGQNHE